MASLLQAAAGSVPMPSAALRASKTVTPRSAGVPVPSMALRQGQTVVPKQGLAMPKPNLGARPMHGPADQAPMHGPSQQLKMPKPRGPNWNASLASSGRGGMGNAAGVGMGAAVGAMAGGVYGNRDGSTMAGIGRGALGGAILGAMGGMGAPAIAKAGMARGMANKQFMSVAGSYSSNMVKATRALSSEGGRTAMFAAGGLLGGAAFGGQGNSKKRGFNRDRGNSFSR